MKQFLILLLFCSLVVSCKGKAQGNTDSLSKDNQSTPTPTSAEASTSGNTDEEAISAPTTEADPARMPSAQSDVPPIISARHVLIQYKGAERASTERTKEEAQKRAEKIRDLARAKGTEFASLAKYSDEPGAAERGGSLQVFGRGNMVPAFEEKAFALGIGQVSDVVETPFGFHVIVREPVYVASLILILFKSEGAPPEITRSQEEAKKLADEAYKELQTGDVSFEEASKKYSDDPNAKLGIVAAEILTDAAMPPEILEVILPLKEEEISKPVSIPVGYFIFQKRKLEWGKAAHILISYKDSKSPEPNDRSKAAAKKLADKVYKEASAENADFAALAKKYSEDKESKEGGGELQGFIVRGQDPSILSEPVLALSVGNISEVIETPFGFHIFKRLPLEKE